jgi:uncharacterized repeat protein (TIGR03803 family)
LARWAALLALAIAELCPSTAFATTNRVGVLNVTYTMTCSGSGSLDWYVPGYGLEVESDSLSTSSSGSVQYEVLQTATNLLLGDTLSSTGQDAASGSGTETQTYPSGDSISADWTYRCVSQGNCLILWWNSGTVPSDFSASCFVNYAMDLTGDPDAANNFVGQAAVYDTMRALTVDFYLIDYARPWNKTLSAAGGVTNSVGAPGVNSGYETLNVHVDYVPDQLIVPFTVTPTNGVAALTVQFGSETVDSTGTSIATWHWDFGDGTATNVTASSFSHRYITNGVFPVSLSATNIGGIAVKGIGPASVQVDLPTLQFTAWPTNGWMPLTVGFSFPPADSGNNSIESWSWDFGDQTTSTSRAPSHVYINTKSKTYSPSLKVTNYLGLAITAKGPKISAVYPPILFTASPTNGLIPMQVQFSSPDVDAFGVAIKGWTWYFGDGGTSTVQNPSHTYTNRGLFAPALLATNANKALIAGYGPSISAGYQDVIIFGTGASGYDPSLMFGLTNSDGTHPQAGLVLSSNRLYGVMSAGGLYGSGTIFTVNTDGSGFTNLHYFGPVAMMWYTNADGATPVSRLVLAGQTLYGAAASGGTNPMGGALFRINTDGSGFTNLQSFGGAANAGVHPNGLVLSGSTLYGAAEYGGSNYNGTIFKLNTDGSGFAAIHHFSPSGYDSSLGTTNADGVSPMAALTLGGDDLVGRILYGTASQGGGGGGTVFKLNTNGSGFTVLHYFTNTDGSTPEGELLLAGNTLYGTTYSGGSAGEGAVFKVNTDGSGFATLYSFSAANYDSGYNLTNSDGAKPSSGLCWSGGLLYGATQSGGTGGSGTVFAVSTNGTGFTTLYNFTALVVNSDTSANTNIDGANPAAGVVLADGYLFGTAPNGGSEGYGALFALSLITAPPRLGIQFSGGALLISWPSGETGWTLEQCTDLAAGNWTAAGLTISDDGTTKQASLPPPAGNLFFRLAK